MMDAYDDSAGQRPPKSDFKIKVTLAGSSKERRVNVAHIVSFADRNDINDPDIPNDAKSILWVSTVPVKDLPEDGIGAQFTTLYVKETPEELAKNINGTVEDGFVLQLKGSALEQKRRNAQRLLTDINQQIDDAERAAGQKYQAVLDEHATPRVNASKMAEEIEDRVKGTWKGRILFKIYNSLYAPMADDGSRKLLPKVSTMDWVKQVVWNFARKSELGIDITGWQANKSEAHKHFKIEQRAGQERDLAVAAVGKTLGKARLNAISQIQSPRLDEADIEMLQKGVLKLMRRKADPDFYVFAPDYDGGVYMNRVGEVDPVSHALLDKPKNPLAVGRVKRPWNIT